jgi:hypothetical protein
VANFTWIEGWYNARRGRGGIGQKSPVNFEKELQDKANANVLVTAEMTSAGELKVSSNPVREIRVGPRAFAGDKDAIPTDLAALAAGSGAAHVRRNMAAPTAASASARTTTRPSEDESSRSR